MDKFGMNFGGGPSRKELQDTIETQKKQLSQYQTRLKDVVRAYKSLSMEKEALESSIKVLSVSQVADLKQDGEQPRTFLSDDRSSEDSLDTGASLDASETGRADHHHHHHHHHQEEEPVTGSTRSEASGSESGSVGAEPPESDRRVLRLRSQLSTLTNALATVTQEKSRMEANYQADKRQLKQEVEELQERVATATSQHEGELHNMQQQLVESRARVITQQHERDQEQGDQLQQLRELQKLLQQERSLRQDAELRLHDANAALLVSSQAVDRRAESEAHLGQVRDERDELKRRLAAAEEEQKKPDPRVAELQQELTKLKTHFQQELDNETIKTYKVEERAHERAQAAEARVAGLEQRLSEMSDLLGACEKTRQKDLQSVQRLRDRVAQLDTENKTLALAAASRSTSDLCLDESQLDVPLLKEKLQKVKKLLQMAAQRNPDKIIQEDVPEAESGPAASEACQQELRQLKDEFERYKVRAQVVLKNKNTKDGCQAKELEEVRDQLAELKEKYINLRIQSDEAETKNRQQLDEGLQAAAALQLAHKQEVERVEAQHRDELLRFESELHKQRARTMALLDEKDQELERLRASTLSLVTRDDEEKAMEGGASDEESESDPIHLRLAGSSEPTLLLYAEQLARKEVETSGLRRQKNRLEQDVRQLQAKMVAHAERHDEEASGLRARIDKLTRDQGREGANLEYLKNILYKFLTLQDASGRHQTLNAILIILRFSEQEKETVFRLQLPAWWTSSSR